MTTSYIRECNTQMTTMYDMTLIPWTIFGYEVASCDVLTYLNLIHETNHFSKPNNKINWEKNNHQKRAWIVLFSNSKAEINYHDAIIYDYDKKKYNDHIHIERNVNFFKLPGVNRMSLPY